MSVPSLKTIVTTETPNLEIDRICSTSGSPLIAPETGNDSSESTSSGESAGASVITWTCTFVKSGTASIGKWSAEYTPTPATSKVAISTKKRLFSDDSMMALSMGHPLLTATITPHLRLVLKDQLALEQESAGGDDLSPCVQAGLDHDAVAGLAADLDRSKSEVLVVGVLPGRDEDIFLGFDLDDRARRDGQHLLARWSYRA